MTPQEERIAQLEEALADAIAWIEPSMAGHVIADRCRNVLASTVPSPFQVGDEIIEKQHNGHSKTVKEVHPGSHIIAQGFTRSRIAWRNLKRYKKVES